ILTGLISCKKDNAADPNVVFKATLTGGQEAPTPNASTATGTATLTFNATTKIFTLAVTHTVATPTNGHIHKAATGVSGGVIFPFATFTSPINYTSVALDATQEADLNANLYYVNIHTAAYPAGEIRGQLIKQ
ncbi:MAG: CHRD domain-containing protein, partial [Bacteroidia bacterium]|nr:CHRD domain-containing protein [Bacteroidia bacterium]